jgi:hypothetical protein
MLTRKSSMHHLWCESPSLRVDVRAIYSRGVKIADTQTPKVHKAEVSNLFEVSDLFLTIVAGRDKDTDVFQFGRAGMSGVTTFTCLLKSLKSQPKHNRYFRML